MRLLRTLLCLMLALSLTGCSLEAPANEPAPTLPPIAPDDAVPLGDAGLRHQAIAALYLPAHNGQNLLAFYETLSLSYDQHPAEAIIQALLAHPGNARVRALGGSVRLSLSGANPVEVSGGTCTVNLSATALQLSQEDLYTAALAIAATLCELDDIDYVCLLAAGTPVAMDVSGCLPLGSLTAQLGQDLPVLWEQFAARRAPVGTAPAETPLNATATLYFPLSTGGICATTRRLSFPGQDPIQLVLTLLEALSIGADLPPDACELHDLTSMLSAPPEVTELERGGKRLTLHFTTAVRERLRYSGCDVASAFAAMVYTLTTFVPSLQQVCILTGDGALTSLYSAELGSMLFPGGLHTRSDYAHALRAQRTVYLPADGGLTAHTVSLPYRTASSPRALLMQLSPAALPRGLTDADILGLSITEDTLRINLSARYGELLRQPQHDERLTAYAIVNTLCEHLHVRRVRFAFGGETIDTLQGDVLWSGEFYYDPELIIP